MVRYYSLIEVLPCPDLIINIVENLAYTPRSAFDVVSKFPLVEGSVIIYGLNPQGALFLSHSQICIHKTVVRYSQVGHTSQSDFLWWLTIIRSISVCAVYSDKNNPYFSQDR